MSFEACPREAVESLHDPGIFYVYENGVLRTPNGYARVNEANENDKEFYFPKEATYNSNTGFHNAPSLLHITTDFVADRIECVDSLIGFPELIGEALFRRIVRKGTLSTASEDSKRILHKFSEAYSELVCDVFVLRNRSVCLENCVDILINCFSHLSVLDLHGCKIGDEHDMIRFISENKGLKKLGLAYNSITNHGLQKLTTPLRVFKRGPRTLEVLDLSDNPGITDGGTRYICAFPNLQSLDLTRTRVSEAGIAKVEQSTNLRRAHTELTHQTKPSVIDDQEMKGWATEVLMQWIRNADPFVNQPGLVAMHNRGKLNFYGAKQRQLEKVLEFQQNRLRKDAEELNSLSQECLIFEAANEQGKGPLSDLQNTFASNNLHLKISEPTGYKTKYQENENKERKHKKLKSFSFADTISQVTQESNVQDDEPKQRKRKLLSEKKTAHKRQRLSDSVCNNQTKTPLGLSSYSVDEQDIMQGYLTTTVCNKPKATSLFDALDT